MNPKYLKDNERSRIIEEIGQVSKEYFKEK